MSDSITSALETANAAAAEPAKTEESKAPETAGKLQEEVDFSSRFAALSKRERDAVAREQRLKKLLEEKEEKLKPWEEFESKKSRAKEDVSVVDEILQKHLGISFEDYLNMKVSQGEKPEPTLDDKYKEIEKRLNDYEERQKSQKELEEQQKAEQQISLFKNEISDHIKKNVEKYELINHFGLSDEVFNKINAHFSETGELMEFDEACNLIESDMERVVEGALPLNKLKAKYAKLNEQPKAEMPKTEQKVENAKPQLDSASEQKVSLPKTLTNSMQSQSPSTLESSIYEGEELKKRSIEKLKQMGWK